MTRFALKAIGGLALLAAVASTANAQDRERVIVLDAPDIQRLATNVAGARISDVIGTDVYTNSGNRIGEVEDFVLGQGGFVYAVIDIQEGVLDGLLDITDDDLVVVPWNQLRVSSIPE